MGSDDLFRKNKRGPKTARDLSRRASTKLTPAKILIVCEGKKTEPYYFEELTDYYELLTANVIDVTGNCGSSPMCVFKHAKETQKDMIEKGAPYDEIYIVIDKDAHTDYQSALDAIRRIRLSGTWYPVNSIPCFEYWLLLHFTYTTKAYRNLPGNSSGNQIVNDLKKHIKDYEKGSKQIFSRTLNSLKSKSLKEVIEKSKRSLIAAEDSGTDNPSTKIHILVERLLELKNLIDANKR